MLMTNKTIFNPASNSVKVIPKNPKIVLIVKDIRPYYALCIVWLKR